MASERHRCERRSGEGLCHYVSLCRRSKIDLFKKKFYHFKSHGRVI